MVRKGSISDRGGSGRCRSCVVGREGELAATDGIARDVVVRIGGGRVGGQILGGRYNYTLGRGVTAGNVVLHRWGVVLAHDFLDDVILIVREGEPKE